MTAIKIILVGDPCVGKSSILQRFCSGSYEEVYKPTLGVDFFTKIINKDGSQIKLSLWDTAGQERFNSMSTVFYRSSQGAIVVFDLTKQDTLHNVPKWKEDFLKNVSVSQSPVLVVGNKLDCNTQCIDDSVIDRFCREHRLPWTKVSAKMNQGVEEAFSQMLQLILNNPPEKESFEVT
eukprot:TRINITY_DN6954_c0_g1_i4.p1 TRINITY_DN6954_c0_g1~~TRINITY_DN6954_c0_g1_i4.p1  ORF type:complete len:178 (-),score=24.31 TRINITY_DN6954_c0_g1_i4:247-780(-)